jgi:hypothetical protein
MHYDALAVFDLQRAEQADASAHTAILLSPREQRKIGREFCTSKRLVKSKGRVQEDRAEILPRNNTSIWRLV